VERHGCLRLMDKKGIGKKSTEQISDLLSRN
jgi:hypothetical protein